MIGWIPIPDGKRGGRLVEHKFVDRGGLLVSLCGLVEREQQIAVDWHNGPNSMARCDRCSEEEND